MDSEQRITQLFVDSIETIQHSIELSPQISQSADLIVSTLLNDGKILCCGNGPSATLAQHFTGLFINQYEQERPSLPAISLSADGAAISAVANQLDFNQVFAKQVRALGKPDDLLLVISTTGLCRNVNEAITAAQDRDMRVIALTGDNGGIVAQMLSEEDVELRVPSSTQPRVQEVHQLLIHALCDLIDGHIFGGQSE